MDGNRFDAWVRGWRTRRAVVRSLIALGATGVVPATVRADALVCFANGATCDPTAPEQCCTGNCKTRKGKFACAPAGSAQGCTKRLDACRGSQATACPNNLTAEGCIVGKGKPICAASARCSACRSDADCTAVLGSTARCVTGCGACRKSPGGFTTICVLPAPPPTST